MIKIKNKIIPKSPPSSIYNTNKKIKPIYLYLDMKNDDYYEYY